MSILRNARILANGHVDTHSYPTIWRTKPAYDTGTQFFWNRDFDTGLTQTGSFHAD